MNKAMTFTVTDSEGGGKPIVWAQTASSAYKDVQELAEGLIRAWADQSLEPRDRDLIRPEIEDLAYAMRKEGYAWFRERWCFELTEIFG